MREYRLDVYDLDGDTIAREPVRLNESLGRTVLHRLARRQIIARNAALGALVDGRRVKSVYFAKPAIPAAAVSTSGSSIESGAWFTSVAALPSAVRGLTGPDAFLRQLDVTVPWIARILMRFDAPAETREHTFGRTRVVEFNHGSSRYFYVEGRGAWRLYGAGTVSQGTVDEALSRGVETADDLFWALGAIKLGR